MDEREGSLLNSPLYIVYLGRAYISTIETVCNSLQETFILYEKLGKKKKYMNIYDWLL